MIQKLLLASLALLAGVAAAHAEYVDLGGAVDGHPGKTWADIVRVIVPDLDAAGQGTSVVELPYIVDLGDSDPPPQPELPVRVGSVEVEPIRAGGRTLTVLLVDLGMADGWAANVAALALLDENLDLLDVVNVGQDRMNALRLPLLEISADDEALLVYSAHGNSNQAYGAYGLIMVRDGKFQLIDTYATLDDHWCGHERTQRLAFEIPSDTPGFRPIHATITDRQSDPDPADDCGDEVSQPGFENSYRVTYTWSASMGMYVADGNGLAPVYEMNEARY